MSGIEKLAHYLFGRDEGENIGQEEIEKVKCALEKLPADDNTIISKRYGIGEDRQYTLMELAAVFGTDREWVRQKEARILLALKREID